MYPKVSIQIPTYNQQGFIQKTIESCLMQDYPNLEINIADDHSTDDSYTLLQPYLKDKRVRYFTNETNIGRVANYHKALYEYATGEWVLNLDGDDYLTDSGFISRAISHINQQKDQDIVAYIGNQDIVRLRQVLPGSLSVSENALLVSGPEYFINYYKILHFNHCTTLYKRSEAVKLDFYSFECLFTDFNSMAKLFLKGNIIISSDQVAHWNRHSENASSTLSSKNIKKELAAINELADFAQQFFINKAVAKWRRKMKGFILYTYLNIQVKTREKQKALGYLIANPDFSILHIRQSIKAFIGAMGFPYKNNKR